MLFLCWALTSSGIFPPQHLQSSLTSSQILMPHRNRSLAQQRALSPSNSWLLSSEHLCQSQHRSPPTAVRPKKKKKRNHLKHSLLHAKWKTVVSESLLGLWVLSSYASYALVLLWQTLWEEYKCYHSGSRSLLSSKPEERDWQQDSTAVHFCWVILVADFGLISQGRRDFLWCRKCEASALSFFSAEL